MNKFLIFSLLVVWFAACNKEDKGNENIVVFLPSNFPKPVYNLELNPVTEAGFKLGKQLFYDPILSRDSTIACADCHISFSAFSHPDHATSHGIDGLFGKRNAPAVQNLLWQTAFFWDGGVPDMDLISINPIQNPLEMDESPARVVWKLNRNPLYQKLFKAAFPGKDSIDGPQMMQAFSQFMAMLVSANSRYDKHVRNEQGGDLNASEIAGLQLFKEKCSTCHATDLFTDGVYRNNGILSEFTNDKGRFEVSSLPDDIGKFKTPSLRNVAVTQPYMHNGKFKTLESVLEHYATGVKDSPTLDPALKQHGVLGIPLSQDEQSNLIAFLKTLTDETFIRDERFQQN
ncbi:MAG: cytochrome-c peroxidase [Saprospiraceae bacterium]|nr:cytochrome-c peroxidase [Saprospiraceae bacterium]